MTNTESPTPAVAQSGSTHQSASRAILRELGYAAIAGAIIGSPPGLYDACLLHLMSGVVLDGGAPPPLSVAGLLYLYGGMVGLGAIGGAAGMAGLTALVILSWKILRTTFLAVVGE